MLRDGVQNTYITRRVNMPTRKSHAELVREVSPKIKAQAFFSARVAEAHILDKLREISDGYSRGEMGLGEARNRLKDFLKSEGYDPHKGGLKNLASTARLNLILKQNAAMAHAAGEWQRMHDPDAMKVFPFVRYHCMKRRSRDNHAALDGKIFDKNDPFLRTHTPPWDFHCHCTLEEITAKEAGKTPELIQPKTPEDQVTVDSESGFVFDPEHAFSDYYLKVVKSPVDRGNIREEAEIAFGDQVYFEENNFAMKLVPKSYGDYAASDLPSAQEWPAVPSPKDINPETARKKLEQGFMLTAADGRKCMLDHAVLDHWEKEENKLPGDVLSRLTKFQYVIETLLNPVERWDQETQCRYLKKFQKKTGGYEGCIVAVTNNGKCRSYFLPSVSKINTARNGIGYEIF